MGKLIIRLAVILGFLLRWNKGSRLIFSEIPGYTKNDTLILLFILFPDYEAPPLVQVGTWFTLYNRDIVYTLNSLE